MNDNYADNCEEALGRVVEQTLEQLAFLFAMPDESAGALDDSDAQVVRIGFSGPFGGELFLALSSQAIPELIGNMLGVDDGEALPLEQQDDALRELLNVVCGNLLPEIAGPKAVFDLTAPELLGGGSLASAIEGRTSAAQMCFSLDEGGVATALFLEKGNSE